MDRGVEGQAIGLSRRVEVSDRDDGAVWWRATLGGVRWAEISPAADKEVGELKRRSREHSSSLRRDSDSLDGSDNAAIVGQRGLLGSNILMG